MIPGRGSTRAPLRGEMVALTTRLGLLQGCRAAFALTVVAGTQIVPRLFDDRGLVLAATATYIASTALGELYRRRARGHGSAVISANLLVDGVWLALVSDHTGGPRGEFAFLALLHVVVVSLLLSHRTGLKVALWHCLLTLVVASAWAETGQSPVEDPAVAVAIVALVLVAVGTAWCSSLNERALRRGKADLAALVSLGDDVSRAKRVDEVHLALVRHATDRLGFLRAAVMGGTTDGIGGAVRADGRDILVSWRGTSLPAATPGWPEDAEEARGPELCKELDPDRHGPLDAALPWAVNVVVIALVADRLPPATLVAEWGGGPTTKIPTHTVDVLVQSASHAALALANTALLAEVEVLATRDGLTGLVNRRVFDEALVRAVHGAERNEEPLGLVVLDLDHFKAVNDTYGHLKGDEVLREVGRALSDMVRGSDLAARYGGEEFAVLLPGCPADRAFDVAERLRAGITDGVDVLPVTVSAGVASVPEDALSGSRLIAAADAALYCSKREGRDRTTRAGVPATPVAAVG